MTDLENLIGRLHHDANGGSMKTPLGDYGLCDEAARALTALQAENERLRKLLTECSDDLAAELEARYPEASRVYPGEARRYARDMDVIIRVRAALKGETP